MNLKSNIKLLLTILIFFFCITPSGAFAANTQNMEAVITTIREEKEITIDDTKQHYQQLEALVTSGSLKGKKILVENAAAPSVTARKFRVNDNVMVTATKDVDNTDVYYITDYVRRDALYWLGALFVGITVLIGGRRGLASLFGMICSFVVIFTIILPQISAGHDPVFVAILASLIIIPVTFYLSHGVNKKTTIAIAGTVLSLCITGILAAMFVEAAKFSGFASEEAGFVEASRPGFINMQGLLLAGIIIGVLGVLDDITISQAAIVQQLKKTAPHLTFLQLYKKAMHIGKDHIASVVNTLVLVYTGAALPLLLLFINTPSPFTEVINHEIIAEEIVRTLVASIGLILAVPMTTCLTAYMISRRTK